MSDVIEKWREAVRRYDCPDIPSKFVYAGDDIAEELEQIRAKSSGLQTAEEIARLALDGAKLELERARARIAELERPAVTSEYVNGLLKEWETAYEASALRRETRVMVAGDALASCLSASLSDDARAQLRIDAALALADEAESLAMNPQSTLSNVELAFFARKLHAVLKDSTGGSAEPQPTAESEMQPGKVSDHAQPPVELFVVLSAEFYRESGTYEAFKTLSEAAEWAHCGPVRRFVQDSTGGSVNSHRIGKAAEAQGCANPGRDVATGPPVDLLSRKIPERIAEYHGLDPATGKPLDGGLVQAAKLEVAKAARDAAESIESDLSAILALSRLAQELEKP